MDSAQRRRSSHDVQTSGNVSSANRQNLEPNRASASRPESSFQTPARNDNVCQQPSHSTLGSCTGTRICTSSLAGKTTKMAYYPTQSSGWLQALQTYIFSTIDNYTPKQVLIQIAIIIAGGGLGVVGWVLEARGQVKILPSQMFPRPFPLQIKFAGWCKGVKYQPKKMYKSQVHRN
ncbi:hypothetical protein ACET3Z_000012 [Daucus carota]